MRVYQPLISKKVNGGEAEREVETADSGGISSQQQLEDSAS
jgi:hypothetical protein